MARFLQATYGRQALARLLYAVIGGPLALLGFGYALLVLVPGTFASVTLIGLPWLATGVRAARGPAAVHRRLIRVLLREPIESPPRPPAARGGFGWIRVGLTDATGWRALAYLVLKLAPAWSRASPRRSSASTVWSSCSILSGAGSRSSRPLRTKAAPTW